MGLGEQGCLQKVSSEKSQLKKGAQKKSARPNRAGLSGSVSFNHLPVPVGIYCPTAYLYIWTTPWLTVKGRGNLDFEKKSHSACPYGLHIRKYTGGMKRRPVRRRATSNQCHLKGRQTSPFAARGAAQTCPGVPASLPLCKSVLLWLTSCLRHDLHGAGSNSRYHFMFSNSRLPFLNCFTLISRTLAALEKHYFSSELRPKRR